VEPPKKRQDCKKSKSVVISQGASDLSLSFRRIRGDYDRAALPHDTRSLMLEDCLHILRKGGHAHAYVRI